MILLHKSDAFVLKNLSVTAICDLKGVYTQLRTDASEHYITWQFEDNLEGVSSADLSVISTLFT